MKNLIPILIICITFIILSFITAGYQAYTQSPEQAITPLSVGDQMPTIQTPVKINALPNKETINSTSDKLMIIEFINTHCGTCRQSIPHLQQLQKAFPDDLVVLLVSRQKNDVVRDKAAKYGWTLPIITEDTTLSQYFPYRAVPHQVWIQNHKVLAITNWQYANETNIHTVLSGQPLLTPLKHEEDIDLYQPLLQMSEQTTPLYQASITGRIPNGLQGLKRTANAYLLYNYAALSLFEHAYALPTFPVGAYTRLELSDSLTYLMRGPLQKNTGLFHLDQQAIEWEQKHNFCYNIVFPEGSHVTTEEYQSQMRNDLNAFFSRHWGVQASIQPRETLALVLEAIDTTHVWQANEHPVTPAEEVVYSMTNKPIKAFINNVAFYQRARNLPVVNETGYHGKISLDLTADPSDLDKLNETLAPYGLRWTIKKTKVDLLIITSIEPKTNEPKAP